jgi:diguanylate cyclase (GGDEF)-like protein
MTESVILCVTPERAQSWTRALNLAGLEVVPCAEGAEAALLVTDGYPVPKVHVQRMLEVLEPEKTTTERMIARVSRRLEAMNSRPSTTGIDPLTGLPDREHLTARIENEVELSARIMKPFAVAILDPDGLDALADSLGDQAADRALAEFSQLVRERLRRVDGVGRWGRWELGVVMPATYPTQAMMVISRLQDQLAASDSAPGRIHSFTAAVAAFPIDADSAGRLTELAESRLADAKRKGDGRIVMV